MREITMDSIKRFRLAYVDESEGKSDEEIKTMISDMMEEKKKVDNFIITRTKSYEQINSERSRLANNCRRNYKR